MNPEGSITHWLRRLQAGEQQAAQGLWERYFHRLVGLARAKLRSSRPAIADEEDVALSAFDSFCRAAEQGRFPQLADRENLWRVLMVITARKALHLMRDEQRLKRGGAGSGKRNRAAKTEEADLEEVIGSEPSPDFAAQVADECKRLLRSLTNKELEKVALMKMDGYSNDEIATQLDCAPRSVGRKLQLIRDIWENEGRCE
jgi:DNA-directed RNA polymerase specialized sigma24 family protein